MKSLHFVGACHAQRWAYQRWIHLSGIFWQSSRRRMVRMVRWAVGKMAPWGCPECKGQALKRMLSCSKSAPGSGAKHISTMVKAPQLQSTFGSCNLQKVLAVVARSTCRSHNSESTTRSEHFWKLRCRNSARHCGKSARRCGTKRISKPKCQKHHHMFGPLLNVEPSFCVAGAIDSAPCQAWTCQLPLLKEVSQNCFLSDFQIDRWMDR